MKDSKPDKQPKTRHYLGCPPTKYRNPTLSSLCTFDGLDELIANVKDDISCLELDMSKVIDGEVKLRKFMQGFSGSFKGKPRFNFKFVDFDSEIYNYFVRLYRGNAEFDGSIITQYEIAVSESGFMMVFYAQKADYKFLMLRTNDENYVKSHANIEWEKPIGFLEQTLAQNS